MIKTSAVTISLQGIRYLSNLILIPLIISKFGYNTFGLISILISSITATSIIEAFLYGPQKNVLIELTINKELKKYNQILSNSISIALLSLFIQFGLLILFIVLKNLFISNDLINLTDQMSWLILIGAINFILISSFGIVEVYFFSKDNLFYIRLIEIFITLIINILCGICLYKDYNLYIVFTLFISAVSISRIILFIKLVSIDRHRININISKSFLMMKENYLDSKNLLKINLYSFGISALPLFIFSKFSSLELTAHYSIIQRLIATPLSVIPSLLPQIWIVLKNKIHIRGLKSIKLFYMYTEKYMKIFFLVFIIGLSISLNFILKAWIGNETEIIYILDIGLCAFFFLQMYSSIQSTFLNALNVFDKQNFYLKNNFIFYCVLFILGDHINTSYYGLVYSVSIFFLIIYPYRITILNKINA